MKNNKYKDIQRNSIKNSINIMKIIFIKFIPFNKKKQR